MEDTTITTKTVINKAKELFSLDLRSLALMRITVGGLIITDLFIRLTGLEAHYTDKGVLPRSLLEQLHNTSNIFSVHMLSGDTTFQLALFILAIIIALFMMIGFQTRIMTILTWFMLISLQGRNHMVLQGGDVLLRLVMIWAIFLPWGEIWSIDSLRKGKRAIKNFTYFSAGSIAYIVQIISVYLFTAILKTSPEWRSDGTALANSLLIDQFTTQIGYYLLNFKQLLRYMTLFFWHWEAFLWVPFFFPFKTGYFRTAIVLLSMGVHFGSGLTLHLGPFPWVTMFAWAGLLPAKFWELLFYLIKKLFTGSKAKVKDLNPQFKKVEKFINSLYSQPTKPVGYRAKLSKYWKTLDPLRFSIYTTVVILLMFSALLWNLRSVNKIRSMPAELDKLTRITRIDQYWNMFSPFPLKEDGWYVVVGNMSDGRTRDLFQDNEPVNWEKPAYVAKTYPSQRWRKYLMNLWDRKNSAYRSGYLDYLCRKWIKEEPSLESIQMYFMLESTLPDYKEDIPTEVLLESYACP